MSFANFQELPSHNLNIQEFHPAPVSAPPVFNTSETIAPLLHLAEYLSPDARAKRKAAVAKANYEYRLYSSGDPRVMKDPFFYQKRSLYDARIRHVRAQTRKLLTPGADGSLPPAIKHRFDKDFGAVDYSSPSTPPAAEENNVDASENAETVMDNETNE